MMPWLGLLLIALGLLALGKWLASKDEVYGLAVYAASTLMALWGLAIAPTPTPITLGVLALGWMQVTSPKLQ